ncbi:MAG: ATP-binding protein [Bacteroidota bacterium]
MISGLTTNPRILKELFDRLDVGCIIFELEEEVSSFLTNDEEGLSLFDLSDQLVCTSANKILRKNLRMDHMIKNYSLKNWLTDFPEARDYLDICQKNGEVSFSIFFERFGPEGMWISGEYFINYDVSGKFEYLIGIFRDTSHEKKLEQKITLNENKLDFAELILEISQKLARIGTWRFDLKSYELNWTETLFQIYDIPEDTPNLYEVFLSRIHPEDLLNFNTTFENAVQTGSSYTVRHRAIRRNGQVVYLSGNGHPVRSPEGEVVGYFGLCQDISDLKYTQIELERSNRSLEDKVRERTRELEMSSQKMKVVLEQLQRQNEQLQQYTYIVSHNLRAPVANISGLSELFDFQNANSQENQEIIQHIGRVSKHLDQIIRDLNEILSTEGKINEAATEINLKHEVERVCEELNSEVINQNARININIIDVYEIKGVRGYIFSILHNLLENALKYRHPDRDPEIEIGAKMESRGYSIWVKDNGLGIDLEKDADKLFKLKSRLNDSEVQGMGMGLFLVKSHSEQLGGKVDVESQAGAGSCFRILFPE